VPTPHRRCRQHIFATRFSSCCSAGRAGGWQFCLTHTIHAALQNTAAYLTGKDVALWSAEFPYPAPNLRFTDYHSVGKLSAINESTRLNRPSNLAGKKMSSKYGTEVETCNNDKLWLHAAVWLHRSKSVSASLGCSSFRLNAGPVCDESAAESSLRTNAAPYKLTCNFVAGFNSC